MTKLGVARPPTARPPTNAASCTPYAVCAASTKNNQQSLQIAVLALRVPLPVVSRCRFPHVPYFTESMIQQKSTSYRAIVMYVSTATTPSDP